MLALRSIALAATIVLASVLAAPIEPAQAEEVGVTFVLVNDNSEMSGQDDRGGFARLATVIKNERAKGGTVIFAHAGDTISPSLLSGFDQGEHIIALTNMAPPDVFVPGNHEFDFGPEIFMKRMGEASFPILAANLRGADGNPIAGIEDTKMIEAGPAKIGIIGLTADDAAVKSSPGDLKIAPTVETGVAKAGELREAGADIVVVVVHANRATDQELFRSGAFDIILTGDDHDLAVFFDGRTVMVESSEQARYVTAIDLTIDVTEGDRGRRVKWWPNFRPMDTADVEPDPDVQAKIAAFEANLSEELDVTLGTTETALDSRRATVRGGESAIGNLITDAMRGAVNADIAITNGGGIRADKQYEPGTAISRRDILTELPFGNKTVLLEVSGQTLIDALENGVSQIENGGGRFPHVSNVAFTLTPANEAGSRVSDVKVGGAAVDPAASYRLATNDYMARGGDGYTMFKDAKVILGDRDGKLMANHVMAYIRAAGTIAPKVEGRITVN